METNQLMKMFEIVKSSSNPKAMLESMAKSNPNLNKILQQLSTDNSSPKDLFYKVAKERGMSDSDIDEFLKSMKAMM